MSNEVISTRVRLARNLKDYPFPCRLSEQGRKKVIEKVTSAIRDSNSSVASDFNLIKLDDLTEAQGVSLVERHLIVLYHGPKKDIASAIKNPKSNSTKFSTIFK